MKLPQSTHRPAGVLEFFLAPSAKFNFLGVCYHMYQNKEVSEISHRAYSEISIEKLNILKSGKLKKMKIFKYLIIVSSVLS